MDERECYAGPDRIAYLLVPTFFKLLIKLKWPFDLFKRFFFAKGIYEYVIARTKYFDAVFIDSLEKGFDQIVIFGAGFDSRALRFHYLNKGNTILFELDAPITQQNKLKAYLSKGLFIPQNLVFVPIDFNKESLAEKTAGAGFIAGKKTLFMLEGVTMYLSQDAIQSTFRFIADVSAKGSMIVFDYIYGGVLRKENRLYGEKNIYKTVAGVGEEWTFAFEENEIAEFLDKYGFQQNDHSSPSKLEDRFFRNSSGVMAGKINGTHAIVTGIKM
ncbi:MAG: SAM-dependent methyltransferase [Dehalococcoidia bacterium]|nr:SAM-dependent methyltransferase [Dehalococcoidia bacterium]